MFSPLSKGTSNAPNYDQAARNVACVAWALHKAEIRPGDLDSVGFYVLAPRCHIDRESSFSCVSRESISSKVEARAADYKCDPDRHEALEDWLTSTFQPLLANLSIECVAWESLIEGIGSGEVGTELGEFYRSCLAYNGG